MFFELTDEQKDVRNFVRDFCKKEIIPYVDEREREGVFRRDIIERMGELGLFGGLFPPSYGGTDTGFLTQCVIMEEITRASIEASMVFNNQAVNVPMSIYLFGTEEQKRRFVPQLVGGKMVGCFSLTEPDGGSDNAAMKMRAVRKGDCFVLNGAKMWATLGNVADVVVTFAKTKPEAGAKGITAFIVETDGLAGLTRSKIPSSIGTNISPSAEMVYEDCEIPANWQLGPENEGLKVALNTLQYGRVCVPARAVGVGQACLDASKKYAQERIAFGKLIIEYQAIQHMIAEMVTLLEASRLLVWRAAWLADQDQPFGRAASIAKYYTGEAVSKIADLAMEIYGGYAFANEYPINRYLMVARLYRTGEGAPNIQRNLIAHDELGWKIIDRHFKKRKS